MAMKRFTKKFGTNPVRLSYCNLDKARAITPGAKEKYSCVLLIPKTDKATVDGLKQAMVLRYYEGCSLEETAFALGTNVNTLNTRLRKARSVLQAKLKGWYFNEED